MADVLHPISRRDRPHLLKELRRDLPMSTVYHWLRMQSEWETKIPSLKLHILCPDGNWSDAAVVAFADGLAADGKQYGVVYAREGRGDERLADALLRTRAIPWHTMIHFTCVLQRHVKPVKVAARAAGVSLPPDNVCYLVNFPQSALKTQYDALS
ncbi:hypothetical protein B566_EDAN016394 [Ephemera danica]|nr:hypothetical protein B566_EDAN016394 [Ephemera danica]